MNLLERLKSTVAGNTAEPVDPQHRLQLAAAVLLLEMQHADNEHSIEEQTAIRAQLRGYFDLDDEEIEALLEAARPEQKKAISLHRYLQALNQELDFDAKREVIEMLWRVAYADTRIDAQEEQLLRHLAELLHLPHREFIKAKLAVLGG